MLAAVVLQPSDNPLCGHVGARGGGGDADEHAAVLLPLERDPLPLSPPVPQLHHSLQTHARTFHHAQNIQLLFLVLDFSNILLYLPFIHIFSYCLRRSFLYIQFYRVQSII